ncbi:acetyl-CoA:acetoacetyl-CoA transferase subunit beta [Rhodovastum atsumiense]|uniref:3-oxoacid CoA-transferase subunit B n=1 Tax=Rhodovastum atsumiense TaxID=504468 RepID=A0A5M6ILF9_9PROT|nr:3-oxoacid CoA-transferase subunit B [Rhodovastum atsumiense]KAA5609002.1 3-oxoacid CoA-transferase subunit B [Rhodovastum atsumiense]CAH2599082.1 acetyl-CoA:acetoacetyl-CoA transferase subunit beta [Rhodovastum atsumiense]
MHEKTLITRRVAQELRPGDLVNLGIGMPSLVANHIPPGVQVFFQAEHGLIGMAPPPRAGLETGFMTDAGGNLMGAYPGACAFDSCFSFGLIRGGHLSVTVLGGLQVDELGRLANWMVPGKIVPGMGGAMDLVSGAKRVIVAMTHTAKGAPKVVRRCSLPITSLRRVDLLVTELAVIEPTDDGLLVREIAPGVSRDALQEATEARLLIPDHVPVMQFGEA